MHTHYFINLTQHTDNVSLPFGEDYDGATRFFNTAKGMTGLHGDPAFDHISLEKIDFTSRESMTTVLDYWPKDAP